ncbi:MAG: hypothetical protein R6X19_08530 [Kiritimatiellia bacterium]
MLLVFMALSIQAMSSRQAVEAVKAAISNAPASPTAPAAPAVTNVVVAETAPVSVPISDAISVGTFVRPAIAIANDGSVFVAAEGSSMQSVYLYTFLRGSAKWAGGVIARCERGGLVNTSRVYVPDVVVDRGGWVFVFMRCGPKEWGVLHGPAVYVRAPTGSGQWQFLGMTTGAARADIDDGNPGTVYLLSKDGAWGAVSRQAVIERKGTFPGAGRTGEKFDFDIVGSRWYTAMNGYSAMPAAFGWGFENAGSRATWAAHAAYPGQGDDLCYPSVCADLNVPGRVYIASVFSGRLRVQVMVDGKPQFPIDNLADLGEATMEDRCPPRLVCTSKGVVAIWKNGNDIQAVIVSRALAGKAKPVRICAGSFPAAAVDAAGKINIVYISGGALRIKTMEAF